ncbi:MAG: DUF1800 family protein [Rhodoferax sp.]|nr:DUF1800 family protein [Rhodoferax sp.]
MVLIVCLTTACGGGSPADTGPGAQAERAPAPEADSQAGPTKQRQSVTINAEGLATALVVRAHGVSAGGVGPIMQVWANGVLIGTVEVRATLPTDYGFTVPGLLVGTRLDIVFTNDATVGTSNRDLIVTHAVAGKTLVLPTAPNVTYDRGIGTAAFDGADVISGRSDMGWSGALRMTWPEPNLTSTVTVRASGTLADGVGPVMALRVDGVVMGSTEVRSTEPADHVFAVSPLAVGSRIDVVYTNDATINGQDRNLNVHYLMAGTTVLLPNAPGVTLDLGSGLAAFDGVGVQPGQSSITSNGALRGRWPAANMTDTLTVRASGTLAGNVGPMMLVLVNGVVLGTTEVRSTTPTDLRFATLPLQPGAQVQVRNTNAGNLNLAYTMAGKTVLRPTDARMQASAATALDGPWPQPNLTDTITVRARGTLAGGVGPVMQVLIDGVLVGTAEVRSTDFADYSFPAFAMQPGRKVDVAFTNDALINGADRNLFVAYLLSGNTFQLPNASGNTFDRGAGAAAFDSTDVIAGTGNLPDNGALRTTWPLPNITSSVTVRASGALAGNVGPIMRLWVDGVAVSSVEVRATSPTDYSLPTPPLQPGSRVNVTFDNPATVDGAQRRLDLAYLMAGTTVLKPSTSGAVYAAGNLQASWPTANLTDTLTVRAYGVLAGNIGPIMQVLVDGVLVGTQEVRATDPADYRFLVPALKPGTKIDVAYTNDSSVNGVDRNLFVLQLMSGNTFQLPTAPGSTYDRGAGAAAFDGLDLIPSTGAVHSNGAVRMTWPEPNLTSTVTVRASGTLAEGVGPVMALRVDGVVVGSIEVRSTEPADHVFAVPPLAVGSRIDVVYINDATINGQDRNLNVHYLMAGTTVLLPTAPGVTLDLGSGLAAFDGVGVQPGQSSIASNGALRGRWPAANMTDTLSVRASGTLSGNVGPLMQVLVNGVVLGTTEIRSSTPTDLRFATLPLQPGAQVQVRNTNVGNLNVAYATAGNTVMRPTDAGVQVSATAPMLGAWPQPNLTDTLTVRARGVIAGNVGPIMQVLVDGVLVGSTEVRSTDFSDHTFSTFPMLPGRKVDVVYTNDATINGVDRNLFVAYLIAGNTSVLPNAAGNTYDRGAGAAAFDGKDVIAGMGTMAWWGALRTTWPQPNITSTVTVRARGTLAGNIGPIMRLWVDGIAVSSTEVRASTPTDYVMPTPALRPGSRIDLAYTNDAVIDGADRNLTVHYLQAGNTYVLPTMNIVQYDLGNNNAAFDGVDQLPGQATLGLAGALRLAWPTANVTDTITVRAYANLAGGIGALMQFRVDGVVLGTQEVRSTTGADYLFAAPRLSTGTRIDLAFLNDLNLNGEDRNLYVQYIKAQGTTLVSTGSGVQLDPGAGEAAFDGVGTAASNGALTGNGALRFAMPAPKPAPTDLQAQYGVSRFLQQAAFGGSLAEIARLQAMSPSAWLAEQMAMPATPDFVTAVQSRFDLGDSWRPLGNQYSPTWAAQRFWQGAASGTDVLRKRVAFALHQTLMVSQADSNLYYQVRPYAAYLDTLNRYAFGNYRQLLEEVALSPAMGLYLSHMRNRPEDLGTGRMPDENFGREVMQLFSIGLQELNIDGTPRLNTRGEPIETYTNDDVMAMSKVFTGWSWAFPDNELTTQNFRWGNPGTSAATDRRIDTLKMKAYPGQHSLGEKRLFAGKPNALVIPAGTAGPESVRLALDALFQHPNVGPFIGRQLIQRLVTSHPSNGYVARVAQVFNNNGSGVRGDLGAVVRAILLDPEASNPPVGSIGKLREPVMRVAHWMRSFGATSVSGQFMLAYELESQGQRALFAPSVFSYFRPGFVPPNTAFSANRITVPEFQTVNESSTAMWANTALAMAGTGLGWTGTRTDVTANLQPLADLSAVGDVDGLIERLNLLLYAGRMSATLKQDLLESVTSVWGNDAASHLNRARVAVFLALASPEYLVQR